MVSSAANEAMVPTSHAAQASSTDGRAVIDLGN
jgi:hypothetical protein